MSSYEQGTIAERTKRYRALFCGLLVALILWPTPLAFSQSSGAKAITPQPNTEQIARLTKDRPLSENASSSEKDKETKPATDPAPTRAEVEQLRNEVDRLRTMVDVLLKEREAAKQPTVSGTTPTVATAPANITVAGKLQNQQNQQNQQDQVDVQELPGRGNTDQGLYGTVAAGSNRGRYGRSLFGENVRIGGYGSFRYEASNIDNQRGVNGLPDIIRRHNGFDIRRLVLTADVSPNDRLRFYTEIELERFGKIEIERAALPEGVSKPIRGTRFLSEIEGQGGSELKLEQFWTQYDFSKSFSVRGGIILPPLGRYNILHDDDYWDIPRRTLVDRDAPVIPVKSAWSEAGIGILGSKALGKGFINYQFYVVNGVTLDFALEQLVSVRDDKTKIEFEPEISFDSGPVNGSRSANAVTYRLGYIPRIGNEIAFSGYHGKYTPDFLQTSAYINSVALDGKFSKGGLEFEGEFVYTDYGKIQRVLADLARNLVNSEAEDEFNETETEVEVGLNGPFTNQRYGFWFDAKYRFRPNWLKNSFLGEGFSDPQLIPIVRYERVWFNKFVHELEIKNGMFEEFETENLSQDRITLGLTYRPVTSIPISFAYEHNRRRNGSTLIFPNTFGLGRAKDRSFDTFVFGVAFGF